LERHITSKELHGDLRPPAPFENFQLLKLKEPREQDLQIIKGKVLQVSRIAVHQELFPTEDPIAINQMIGQRDTPNEEATGYLTWSCPLLPKWRCNQDFVVLTGCARSSLEIQSITRFLSIGRITHFILLHFHYSSRIPIRHDRDIARS